MKNGPPLFQGCGPFLCFYDKKKAAPVLEHRNGKADEALSMAAFPPLFYHFSL